MSLMEPKKPRRDWQQDKMSGLQQEFLESLMGQKNWNRQDVFAWVQREFHRTIVRWDDIKKGEASALITYLKSL